DRDDRGDDSRQHARPRVSDVARGSATVGADSSANAMRRFIARPHRLEQWRGAMVPLRAMAEVVLRDIRKSFDTLEIIHGVSLTVHDGEFVVFVGPSGCGKSTLLRLIAGLETITSGELQIDGKRCNDLPPSDRGIAMVFQSYALYPHMSVFDNMAFSLKLGNMRKDEIRQRVQRAADILQIEPLLARKPKAL